MRAMDKPCRPQRFTAGPCIDGGPGTESGESWAWFAHKVLPRSGRRMAEIATPTIGRERPPRTGVGPRLTFRRGVAHAPDSPSLAIRAAAQNAAVDACAAV